MNLLDDEELLQLSQAQVGAILENTGSEEIVNRLFAKWLPLERRNTICENHGKTYYTSLSVFSKATWIRYTFSDIGSSIMTVNQKEEALKNSIETP